VLFTRLPEVLWRKGLLCKKRGNYKGALADASAAITLTRRDLGSSLCLQLFGPFEFHSALSLSHGMSSRLGLPGRTSRPSSSVQQQLSPAAVALGKKLQVYLLVRSSLHFALRDYTSAISDTSEVLRMSGGTREAAYRQRSLAYTHQGDLEAAINDLERYCHLKPVSVSLLMALFANRKVVSERSWLRAAISESLLARGPPRRGAHDVHARADACAAIASLPVQLRARAHAAAPLGRRQGLAAAVPRCRAAALGRARSPR